MAIKLLTPVDIVIDSREDSKNPDFKREFMRRGLKVAIRDLPAGDFLLLTSPSSGKKPVLVERKTVTDFANSIRDNRVWEQAKLLVEATKRDDYQPFIVIEGWLGVLEKYRGWKIQSVLRVIDTLMIDFGIPVLNTPNKNATIEWLVAKAKSLGKTEEKRVYRLRVEKKPMGLYDRILYVAESIAGPTLARKLLKKFKTLRNLANASIRELMSIEGIGEKRAREIYEVFNVEWRGDSNN
ncbi:MAG: ERCC4 domain-containing protein [Thermoprotei archaeon]